MEKSQPSPDEPTSQESSTERSPEEGRGAGDAAPAPPELPVPDVVDGRYEVLRLLRKGRSGRSFEVRDRQVEGDRVELRLLWPERTSLPGFRDAFFRRANLGQSVQGEHVNCVRDSGVSEDEQLYVTSDLVEGEPLSERLTHEDALHLRHALDVARQVLEALACGHERGVVHGGVRPGNIFLRDAVPKTDENPYGVDVQLAGYGIPRLDVADSEADAHADAVAALMADDLYAAPDWTDADQADSRADLFSLGMVICEMLLGTRAFHSGAALRIRTAVLGGDETRVSAQLEDIEPSVRRILLIALSRKPEGRFANAKEFRLAIESSDLHARKAQAPISLVVAALIAACVGFFLAWRSHREVVSLRETVNTTPVVEQREIAGLRTELSGVKEERDAAHERIEALQKQLTGAPAAGSTVAAQPVVATTPVKSEDAGLWAKILAAGPQADPSRAFELAAKTGDDLDPRLLELVGKYRDGLVSRVVKQRSLDRQALGNETALPKWTELLDKTPAAQSWPASRDVRCVGFARRFLIDGELKPLPWGEVFEPSAAAKADWRHEVYLRAEVLRRHPWLVMDVDQSKVFLHKAGNEVSFVHFKFASPTENVGVINSRIVDRRGDALASEKIRLTRQGTRYEWLDRRLDLVKDAATLAPFEPDPSFADFSVPRQAGVREDERKSWSQALARAEAMEKLSLVFEIEGKKYWISPAFGLVRLTTGDSVQELIVSKRN